ncbi:MAG: hypothetical protein AABZ15_01520 [Nitrospirota bacterium]
MSIKTVQSGQKPKGNVSDGLLGKYAGIVPEGKTSAEFVREERASAYGKVKK